MENKFEGCPFNCGDCHLCKAEEPTSLRLYPQDDDVFMYDMERQSYGNAGSSNSNGVSSCTSTRTSTTRTKSSESGFFSDFDNMEVFTDLKLNDFAPLVTTNPPFNIRSLIESSDTSTDKGPLDLDVQKQRLPTVRNSRHGEIVVIEPSTIVDLLNGKYDDTIPSFLIVDCRYSYEYEGGHIRSAINMSTEDNIGKLLENRTHDDAVDRVIIFHCEFSSKRGPKMCRHLRGQDRKLNEIRYPRLYYPEIYLLEGGYKRFFAENPEHCEPSAYIPMAHQDYRKELDLALTNTKVSYKRKKTSQSRELVVKRLFSDL